MKFVAWMAYHLESRQIADDYISRVKQYLAGHELVICEDVESVKREIADADVFIGWRITAEVFACARKLRWCQFGSAGIDHTDFELRTDRPADERHHSRHVCIFAEGEVDRSPTGTGVSGRAALLHDAGQLPDGETITIESILGTCFGVAVVGHAQVGRYPAVIPEVSGEAFVTGTSMFFLDPGDPLGDGFIFR